jgi:hypothetical protein
MRKYLVSASIAALALAAPALAQVPWSASGELTDSDSQGPEGRRYDGHRLTLEAGQRYRITVNAEGFDPLAELHRPGTAEPVARDDDSGPGLNALIGFTPAQGGDYELRVTSFSAGGRGAYTASASISPPLPAPQRSSGAGEGRIDDNDATDEGEEQRYDEYAVRLEAGRRYRISVDSSDFDSVARLYAPARGEPVAQNDDSDGLNPRISYAPRESGDYILRVVAFSAEGRGAYRYRVAEQAPLPAPSTFFSRMEATIWKVYTGTLAASDPETDGRHFDDYLVHFEAGQERLIRLDATGFDPIVQILRAEQRDGEPLASDDDGGDGLNSMLLHKAEAAGDYIVRVISLGSNGAGSYRLRVSE